MRKVGWAKIIHHGLHLAGNSGVASVSFELALATSDPGQKAEMPARRAAGGPDAVGVDVVFLGVGPQPADRAFDVFDLRGKRIAGFPGIIGIGEAIGDRDGHIAVPGGVLDFSVIHAAVAAAPSAAMNENEAWQKAVGLFRTGEIEFEL